MKYKVIKFLFIIVFMFGCFFSLAKYVSANNNKGVVSIFFLDNDSRKYIAGIKYNIYNGYNQDGSCSGKIIASKVSSSSEEKIELDNGIYCIETLSNTSYHTPDTKEVDVSTIIDKKLPIVLAKKTSNNKGVGSVSIFDHLQSTASAHADYLSGVTYDIYKSSGNCLSRYEKVISGVRTDSYYNSFELDMNQEYCAVITGMPNKYLPSLSSYNYEGGIGYSFYVDSTPYSNEALIGTMKKGFNTMGIDITAVDEQGNILKDADFTLCWNQYCIDYGREPGYSKNGVLKIDYVKSRDYYLKIDNIPTGYELDKKLIFLECPVVDWTEPKHTPAIPIRVVFKKIGGTGSSNANNNTTNNNNNNDNNNITNNNNNNDNNNTTNNNTTNNNTTNNNNNNDNNNTTNNNNNNDNNTTNNNNNDNNNTTNNNNNNDNNNNANTKGSITIETNVEGIVEDGKSFIFKLCSTSDCSEEIATWDYGEKTKKISDLDFGIYYLMVTSVEDEYETPETVAFVLADDVVDYNHKMNIVKEDKQKPNRNNGNNSSTTSENNKKTSGNSIWWVIGIIVAIIAGLGYYAYFKIKKNNRMD